ncbi:helicase HerA domain-containing protein [Candidatus Nanohalococcus occultus]|uniref:VirB4/TraG-like ATPase / HerA helicase n=1 Tax=Candidatus Nanohalococcus occultus TaxID=2978047 RepID=A0ABY8CI11_9ARCH|nr:VirB4/TraG-like ATPase / HerA helicase [Candidatus Nanohaloarchaeota archaeon SVXNc]
MKKTALLAALILFTGATTADISANEEIPSLNVVFSGETQVYTLEILNNGNESEDVRLRPQGDIRDVVDIQPTASVPADGSTNVLVELNPSNNTDVGLYIGRLSVRTDSQEQSIPLGVRVIDRNIADVKLDIQTTAETIRPDQNLTVLSVVSTSQDERVNTSISYEIRSSSDGQRQVETSRTVNFNGIKSYKHSLNPDNLTVGEYYVQGSITNGNRTVTSTDTLTVVNPFWTPTRIRAGILLIAVSAIIGGGVYTFRWYHQRRKDEARYVFPVDYSKLPEREDLFEVGKVAETEKTAYINPKDLTTHAIVAGSTGSGKSVTANVIAEEALENDIPVVVFDPTAQWTGFVKELKDDNLLEHYDRFDMDSSSDPHPYRGVIKEIDSENPDIDFEELKNEGEITVFTLNQLTTEEFDQAVRTIIDQIFEKEWEESPTLEMFIVFDEVHRLLEDYGGQGGYHALEKGAREFRKWGIGLMMCSQVTADFKQAVSGNIMTEIQMQTKSMEDIERVEKKYGEQFSKRISSEDVGTGMIQNSNYNDGEPWFVDFRPTYHNPHKIPDTELKKYHKLSKELDEVKDALSKLEDEGGNIKDKQLELNLAENKLKEGRFKMATMYINSLKDELDIS